MDHLSKLIERADIAMQTLKDGYRNAGYSKTFLCAVSAEIIQDMRKELDAQRKRAPKKEKRFIASCLTFVGGMGAIWVLSCLR